ncbi:MAG: GH25 family lysozyme [Eubacteriales bacterium]|nr:GH25 family lysozyme [Eubacteriales bacterium]
MAEIMGIDVSAYQGQIDWQQVRAAGTRFAILRITQEGNVIDPTFEENYRGCRERDIWPGVYKYCYALNEKEAAEEADKVLEVLGGRALIWPVFYDLELDALEGLGMEGIQRVALAFLERIREGGYLTGIYSDLYWYENLLSPRLKEYDCWIADYPEDDNGTLQEAYRPPYGVGWQYTSRAQIPGIQGFVDGDVFYKNYGEEYCRSLFPPQEEAYMFQPETVSLGSRGNSVLLLQEILRARDFRDRQGNALSLDRIAGDATIYALTEYQRSRKGVLAADGICGPATWRDMIAI